MTWSLPNGPDGSKPLLYPNATVGSGSWWNSTGDFDSDAQYQDWTFVGAEGTAAQGTLELDFSTYTLALDERCAGVKMYVADKNDSIPNVDYQYGTAAAGYTNADNKNIVSYSDYAWHSSSWITLIGGVEWSQTTLSAIRARLIYNSGDVAWAKKYVDTVQYELDIRRRPVATATGPSEGAVNVTLSPTVAWLATTYNGKAQTRFRVKIFSAAQYGAGGFNADTSTTTYDSGWVSGTATSHAVPTGYLSGSTTYRAYVILSVDFNGASWDSAWDYNAFTTIATPTVAVTAPTGTATTTSRPDVTWTFTVSGSNPQNKAQIKIFSAAQYGAGGFDPETSTATFSSGVVSGTAVTYTPTSDILDGTYRAYVKASYALGADDVYSAWAYSGFTLAADRPAVPNTPTATADAANARITLAVQGTDNLLTTNQASLETDTTGWAAETNCTITRSTTLALNGTASLRLSASSAATMAARTLNGTSAVPATAGLSYTALASVRAGATGRTVNIFINWVNAAGVFISNNSAAGTDVTGSWTQLSVTATAPANTAFAYVSIQVVSPANAELHYVDQIKLALGGSTTWTRGGLKTYTRLVVEYSDDAGATWDVHNDMNGVAPTVEAVQTWTLYDYRSTIAVARIYRAYVTATPVASVISGATSSNSSSATLNLTDWWLKDMTDPSLNLIVYPMGTDLKVTSHEQMAVYSPLGRSKQVVVTDVIQGDGFALDLEFVSKAAFDEFQEIRQTRRVLLLQSSWLSQQWWVKIGREVPTTIMNTSPAYRRSTVSFIEVDEP